MPLDLFEIPLASGTALDAAFAATKKHSAVQKLRQELRKSLDPGRGFSLGRLGTVQVVNTALLACLETAGRWSRTQAGQLTEAYLSAGLGELVRSPEYGRALERTGEAIQSEASSFVEKARLVAHVVAKLVLSDEDVREVAEEMRQINAEVDRRLPEFRRLPGHLVRVEGPEALVVVDTGAREELRTVDADFLRSMGIEEDGDTFVQQELRWSPDTVASMFLPAVDLSGEDLLTAELEAELAAAETPLPKPEGSSLSRGDVAAVTERPAMIARRG